MICASSLALLAKAKGYIGISRRPRSELGLRIFPYAEVRGSQYDLERLQANLMQNSIGCTVRSGFLRIQGIDNCNAITPYVKVEWWKEAVLLFLEGEHKKRSGIARILKLRPHQGRGPARISDEELGRILMER